MSEWGLLYQKDADTQLNGEGSTGAKLPFPLTEAKRAITCFRRREEFKGFEPAVLFIHPEHAALVEAQSAALAELGLTWELNPKVARRHLWLTGRPENDQEDTSNLADQEIL